jgi:hypothetical protein
MVAPTPSGYSARVRLELTIGSACYTLAQIGGGRLMFDHPTVLPGTTGTVTAYIDDRARHWRVTWEACATPQRTIMAEFRDVDQVPKPAPMNLA